MMCCVVCHIVPSVSFNQGPSVAEHVESSVSAIRGNRADFPIEVDLTTSDSSFSPSPLMAARKKRKVSFAPKPLPSMDSCSIKLPILKGKHATSRRSTRRSSRLKGPSAADVTETAFVSSKGVGANQSFICIKTEPYKMECLETRKTRSQSANISLPPVCLPQETVPIVEESVCRSNSSVASSTGRFFSFRWDTLCGAKASKRRGRPLGSKNRKAVGESIDQHEKGMPLSRVKETKVIGGRKAGVGESMSRRAKHEDKEDARTLVASVRDGVAGKASQVGSVAGVKGSAKRKKMRAVRVSVKEGTAHG